MSSQSLEARDMYALLIGINCYMTNLLPDKTFYRSLQGCVPDILSVERFLRDELGLTDDRLIKLTASDAPDPSNPRPPEPPELWPTYSNIVAAFRKLKDAARPGAQVYIHYSGHGGRTPALPAHSQRIPGKHTDEALVPTDIGNSEAQYLRDIELAYLLREMVDKGLLVTLVLDSCHSGSATRDGAEVRGSNTIDTTPRPERSLVADPEALAGNWRRAAASVTRDVQVRSGWLPDPRGYVLLAACSAHEGAYEFPFDGRDKRGALTYWLLDAFRELGLGVTYQTVYRHVYARIHTQFRAQTPQLEGEGDRIVFGSGSVHRPSVFTVMSVSESTRQLTLNTGRVHGIDAGARLAIFRAGAASESRERVALVELVEQGVALSTARILRLRGAEQIRQGDEAELLAPGVGTPRRGVRLLPPEGPESNVGPLAEVERVLMRDGGAYVRPAQPDEAAEFYVSVGERGEYLIRDAALRPFPNLNPALHVEDSTAAVLLIERLIHLSKYRSVLELENGDSESALARDFSIELVGPQAAAYDGNGDGAHPLAGPANLHALKAGDWVFLRARNNGSATLNVTVLDLRPDWSVTQIFPSRAGLFETLEAGRELCIPLQVDLPQGYEEGTDALKVFATTEAADFKCLQLPALDLPPGLPSHILRSPFPVNRGPMPFGLDAVTGDTSTPFSPGEDWAVSCLYLSVRRG
jgi:hypothetical protein